MSLDVRASGPLATVQDRGRAGLAHLGVPRGGTLDRPAADLGNRLVGNVLDAAVVEITLGGLEVEATAGHWVAVTGAHADVRLDGRAVGHGEAVWLRAGAVVAVGRPRRGVRSYLAVAGGIGVRPVLGSRSTDTLAWVGPPRVEAGTELPVGAPTGEPRPTEMGAPRKTGPLRVHPGPRGDWFGEQAWRTLCSAAYVVTTESNRIGMRLDGPVLDRVREGELPSEGMVLGAVQVPPEGRPVVFLADHPPTGGYPVIAVVAGEDLWQCAQALPGDEVRFTPWR
jgi:biotin-dependent carboxylase-like uncharacterized protein